MDIIIVAREFFEINLEKEVKNLVNLDTLQVEKNSFVTGDLVNSVSDILYSVKFRDKGSNGNDDRDGFLYLLFEHQSKPDHFMAFRLFKYMLCICDMYLSQNPNSKQLYC